MSIGSIDDLFISDAATALYSSWQSLPRDEDNICPKRFDINFGEIPGGHKKHSFLLTNLGEGVLSASDIRDEITNFVGQRLDGQNLTERYGLNQMRYEAPYCEAVFGQPYTGVLTRRTINRSGTYADFVSCHMPLLDYRNEVRYLLGLASITNIEEPKKVSTPLILDNSQVISRVWIDIGAGTPELDGSNPVA